MIAASSSSDRDSKLGMSFFVAHPLGRQETAARARAESSFANVAGSPDGIGPSFERRDHTLGARAVGQVAPGALLSEGFGAPCPERGDAPAGASGGGRHRREDPGCAQKTDSFLFASFLRSPQCGSDDGGRPGGRCPKRRPMAIAPPTTTRNAPRQRARRHPIRAASIPQPASAQERQTNRPAPCDGVVLSRVQAEHRHQGSRWANDAARRQCRLGAGAPPSSPRCRTSRATFASIGSTAMICVATVRRESGIDFRASAMRWPARPGATFGCVANRLCSR